jgi:hypothetical protein
MNEPLPETPEAYGINPRVWEIHQYLNQEYGRLWTVLRAIPEEDTRHKPAPDSWCVADVVQHLAIIDRRVLTQLQRATSEALARGAGPDPETASILPTIDVSRILDRTVKIRNPRGDPPEFMHVGHALGDLAAVHSDFDTWFLDRDLPNLAEISFPHPAFGNLTGYQWVVFMGAHAHRHTDQVLEIVERLRAGA